MAKIQDIRNITKRTNGTRNLSQIKYIVRHHTATETGDFDSFWRFWSGTRGWGTGGYHEIILRDGTVQLCYDPNEITNGVAGYNTPSYHISLVGNGSFTEAQEKAWDERVAYNMKRLNVGVNNVKGHGEMPSQSTSCPGINMNIVRSRISGNVVKPKKPVVKSSTITKPKANLKVDGIWGREVSKALQNYFNTPIDGEIWGQYHNDVANKITSGVIYGTGGSTVIKALQRLIGAKQDGVLGKETIRKLQAYLKTPIDGELWSPSRVIKALQSRLNSGTL